MPDVISDTTEVLEGVANGVSSSVAAVQQPTLVSFEASAFVPLVTGLTVTIALLSAVLGCLCSMVVIRQMGRS